MGEEASSEIMFENLLSNDSYNIIEHEDDGGVFIASNKQIDIMKTTFRLFELSESFEVNRFTKLRTTIQSNNAELSICLFEDLEETIDFSTCIQFVGEENGLVSVDIGEATEYKTCFIKYLGFRQEMKSDSDLDVPFILRGLVFEQDRIPKHIINGKCVDPHAVINDGGDTCECELGYVSSNGGRIQSEMDQCILCIRSNKCFFEGDECETDDECDQGICENSMCKANVSRSFCFNFLKK